MDMKLLDMYVPLHAKAKAAGKKHKELDKARRALLPDVLAELEEAGVPSFVHKGHKLIRKVYRARISERLVREKGYMTDEEIAECKPPDSEYLEMH